MGRHKHTCISTKSHTHKPQVLRNGLFPVMLTLSSLVSKAVADPVKTQSEKPRTYTPRYLKNNYDWEEMDHQLLPQQLQMTSGCGRGGQGVDIAAKDVDTPCLHVWLVKNVWNFFHEYGVNIHLLFPA